MQTKMEGHIELICRRLRRKKGHFFVRVLLGFLEGSRGFQNFFQIENWVIAHIIILLIEIFLVF